MKVYGAKLDDGEVRSHWHQTFRYEGIKRRPIAGRLTICLSLRDYTVASTLNTVMDRHAALANSFRVHKISGTACYSVVSSRAVT